MSSHHYPFVEVEDEDGVISRPASAYLPVRITNPHSVQDRDGIVVYALIDTGADFCVLPARIAEGLEHNLKAPGVYTTEATGTGGKSTLYKHSFNLEILMPNQKDVVQTFERVLIRCSEEDIPPLLGVGDCLEQFKLTIDYPKSLTTLTN